MATPHHNHDAPAMDYAEHDKTFGLFASMIKWGTVFSLAFVLVTGSFTGLLPWAFTLAVIALSVAIIAKFF